MLGVPYVRQKGKRFCGPAALAMILTYYGVEVTQEEIASIVLMGEYSYDTDLAEFARRKGFDAELLDSLTDDMSMGIIAENCSKGIPTLVLQRYRSIGRDTHYRVVLDVKEESVIFHDPLDGPRKEVKRDVFLSCWKKWGQIWKDNAMIIIRKKP